MLRDENMVPYYIFKEGTGSTFNILFLNMASYLFFDWISEKLCFIFMRNKL